jgi:hypothetical protein
MVPVEHFKSSRKVVAPPGHEDFDYESEMFNVRISCRWRPTIVKKLLDDIKQWASKPAAAPTLVLIGEA